MARSSREYTGSDSSVAAMTDRPRVLRRPRAPSHRRDRTSPRVVGGLGQRGARGGDGVGAGELHPGQLSADLHGEQGTVPVLTSQPSVLDWKAHPPAARTTDPAAMLSTWPVRRSSTRARETTPSASTSSSSAGVWSRIRTRSRCTRVRWRRMYSGPWRSSRIWRPLGVDGERVPLHAGELVHPGVGLVEDAGHPAAVGEVAAECLAAGHRRFAQLGLVLDVPDTGAHRRGGAA